MSTFPLDQMDEHLLKQIVKKFTATSGAGFYCSCRGAKDFVDRIKPVWHFPKLTIRYEEGKRCIKRTDYRWKGDSAKIALEFCRFEEVAVLCCDADYIKTVVLPEVAAVGGVGRLIFGWMVSEVVVPLLISAAKAETVALSDDYLDPYSAIFEGVKNLWITVPRMHVLQSYWRTTKLFELARNRKTITFKCFSWVSKEIIASFIENWVRGEKTGTLERLSFVLHLGNQAAEERREVRKAMEDLMMSHIKTEEGYIVEREGLDRLRICAHFDTATIVFHFS